MALQKSRDFFVVPCKLIQVRYIEEDIERTLRREKKMAFVAGPRQVGKTTFGQRLLETAASSGGCYNWDIDPVRRRIIADPIHFWKSEAPPSRILLDEIHKYPRWKRFLKGFYDANRRSVEILVTGSGRLDLYQRGGDSLFGRYHLYHLLPYSVGELVRQAKPLGPDEALKKIMEPPKAEGKEAFETLWNFNGFPEPLFAADRLALARWQQDHRQLILRQEVRDLTQIREIGLMESLVYLLPERVGSPLSLNALRENLNVNFKTVQNWIQTLDRLYFLFPLRPFSGRLARTLHREEKIYFYDWAELEDEGKRFENLVAVHLLKACRYWTEAGYGDFHLHYLRDREKREVDFLVRNKMTPWLLVEAKISGRDIDPALGYFHERLRPRCSFQIVKEELPQMLREREKGLFSCSAVRFLSPLP